MAVPRWIYLVFYILYLILLAVSLWFILHYSGVQPWVWSFFGSAILILIICIFIKEFLMTRTFTSQGKHISPGSLTVWSVFYVILHIISFILIIVGLAFVIIQSSIPWWVWVILGVAILLSIISTVILALAPRAHVVSIILSVMALILMVVGIIFLLIYSKSPWWNWLLVGFTIFFAIMAAFFEFISEKNMVIAKETKPCVPEQQMNGSMLPAASLPEQTV